MEISWKAKIFYPASLLKNSNLTEATFYVLIPDHCLLEMVCLQDYISAEHEHKPQYVNIVQDATFVGMSNHATTIFINLKVVVRPSHAGPV